MQQAAWPKFDWQIGSDWHGADSIRNDLVTLFDWILMEASRAAGSTVQLCFLKTFNISGEPQSSPLWFNRTNFCVALARAWVVRDSSMNCTGGAFEIQTSQWTILLNSSWIISQQVSPLIPSTSCGQCLSFESKPANENPC